AITPRPAARLKAVSIVRMVFLQYSSQWTVQFSVAFSVDLPKNKVRLLRTARQSVACRRPPLLAYLFTLGESLKPQRQYRAEPGSVCGVIGQIVAGLGMQQDDQIIAIEH